MDFTLNSYRNLLSKLQDHSYKFLTIKELDRNPPEGKTAALRHDVDRLPGRSVAMARLEHKMGIRATYYFRTKSVSFDEKAIRSIAEMGHEIGYHYECLSDTRGDVDAAWELFQSELKKFSPFCEVKTIAMHGRPLLPHDNRDIWKHHDYKSLGLTHEPYLDIPWHHYYYFTDVGRSWCNSANLRDSADSIPLPSGEKICVTEDLIRFVGKNQPSLIISTHPERWTNSPLGWAQVLATDVATNAIKVVVKKFLLKRKTVPSEA